MLAIKELLEAGVLIDRCQATAGLQQAAMRSLDVRDLSLQADQGLRRFRSEHDHLIVNVTIVRDDALRDQCLR